jgi:hypothetical protein
MTDSDGKEPPGYVWYTLDEALELLAVLEDSRDSLIDSGHLTVVLALEAHVLDLNSRLGYDDQGDDDAR